MGGWMADGCTYHAGERIKNGWTQWRRIDVNGMLEQNGWMNGRMDANT